MVWRIVVCAWLVEYSLVNHSDHEYYLYMGTLLI